MSESTPPSLSAALQGWSGAAMAVHSTRQIHSPIFLTLLPSGVGPIVMDFRYGVYLWDTPLDNFPTDPAHVAVTTQQMAADAPSLSRSAEDLDPLLWLIGLNSFRSGPPAWLRPDDRFRLRRWPDLPSLRSTPDQLRTVKVLAKGMMTVEKLAGSASVDLATAQQVVNALSLMGAVRRVPSADSRPMLPPAGDTDALRARLGL